MGVEAAVLGGSAVLGYLGQQDAASSARGQADANRRQSMEQWRLSDPFSAGGHRQQYVGQLEQLMKGGVSGVVDDPSFKAMMAQGMQASQRHASATGTAQSGQEQIALQQQGATMANDFFSQQYNRLAQLSGATTGSSGPGNELSAGDAYKMTAGGYQAMGGMLQSAAGIYGKGSGSGSPGSVDMTGFQQPTSQQFGPEPTATGSQFSFTG